MYVSNKVGNDLALTKTIKSFQLPSMIPAAVIADENKQVKAVQINFYRQKFDRVMRKIGYAIFFNKYNAIWDKRLGVVCGMIASANPKEFNEEAAMFHHWKPAFSNDFEGNNPTLSLLVLAAPLHGVLHLQQIA